MLTTFSDNSLFCVTVYVYFVWLCNPVLRLPYTNKYDLIDFVTRLKFKNRTYFIHIQQRYVIQPQTVRSEQFDFNIHRIIREPANQNISAKTYYEFLLVYQYRHLNI